MTAQTYASITKAVDQLVADHAENDPDRARYLIARAALIGVRATSGPKRAYEMATGLGDEMLDGVIG